MNNSTSNNSTDVDEYDQTEAPTDDDEVEDTSDDESDSEPEDDDNFRDSEAN